MREFRWESSTLEMEQRGTSIETMSSLWMKEFAVGEVVVGGDANCG